MVFTSWKVRVVHIICVFVTTPSASPSRHLSRRLPRWLSRRPPRRLHVVSTSSSHRLQVIFTSSLRRLHVVFTSSSRRLHVVFTSSCTSSSRRRARRRARARRSAFTKESRLIRSHDDRLTQAAYNDVDAGNGCDGSKSHRTTVTSAHNDSEADKVTRLLS